MYIMCSDESVKIPLGVIYHLSTLQLSFYCNYNNIFVFVCVWNFVFLIMFFNMFRECLTQ